MGFFNYFWTIFIIIIVIGSAYWGTKWLSSKYKTVMNDRFINVIERVNLSKDKSIILVKVKEEVYLLGLSGQNFEIISTFNSDAFSTQPKPHEDSEFSKLFKDLIDKKLPFINKKKSNDEAKKL